MDNEPRPDSPPTEENAKHRLSLNEMYEIGTSARENFWRWRWLNLGTYYNDARFRENPAKYFRYEFPPLGTFIPFATLGLLLLVGNFFAHPNIWMRGQDDYTGLLRMGMIFGGAFCIFLAWPRYRDVRVSPEEKEKLEETRGRLWRRKMR